MAWNSKSNRFTVFYCSKSRRKGKKNEKHRNNTKMTTLREKHAELDKNLPKTIKDKLKMRIYRIIL